MATSGYVVQEILANAAMPANRPIDHARRMGTAFSLGTVGGTFLGIATLPTGFTARTFIVTLAVLVVLGLAGLTPWLLKPKASAASVPVVARVLGTKEPVEMRLKKRARHVFGLLVPVVCRPVGLENTKRTYKTGKGDFRAVIMLPDVDPRNPQDPPVGTLIPLMQLEEGMGELVDMGGQEPTAEQLQLIEDLTAHPKQLRNTAPILPIRRSALDRVPAWAAAQFWALAVLGGIVAVLAIGALT